LLFCVEWRIKTLNHFYANRTWNRTPNRKRNRTRVDGPLVKVEFFSPKAALQLNVQTGHTFFFICYCFLCPMATLTRASTNFLCSFLQLHYLVTTRLFSLSRFPYLILPYMLARICKLRAPAFATKCCTRICCRCHFLGYNISDTFVLFNMRVLRCLPTPSIFCRAIIV
jgi:hypothetical protein